VEKATGAVLTDDEDPRITRIELFMRRWRIDEIPQLLNVLKGDMGMAGPRPERPEFVKELEKQIPYYSPIPAQGLPASSVEGLSAISLEGRRSAAAHCSRRTLTRRYHELLHRIASQTP